jgi:outer membrane protein assembly factor BamB
LTGQDQWKADFPSGTLVSALNEQELLAVPRDGAAELIEITTGKRTRLEPIPADRKGRRIESYGLADDDHIYFMANVQDSSGFHHYGESLPSIRANGVIYAWNRSDGKLAWQQDIKNQNLVVDRFRSLPVLLFVTRSWKQKGNVSYGTLSLQAVHKKSGKVLHNSTMPSMYSGFHSLDVNLSEPSIELKSYNMRMRLVPKT